MLYTEDNRDKEETGKADIPSLRLKIYEKIPMPDLAVILLARTSIVAAHEFSFLACLPISLCLCRLNGHGPFLQVIFPHKKLSFRILDTVRN